MAGKMARGARRRQAVLCSTEKKGVGSGEKEGGTGRVLLGPIASSSAPCPDDLGATEAANEGVLYGALYDALYRAIHTAPAVRPRRWRGH